MRYTLSATDMVESLCDTRIIVLSFFCCNSAFRIIPSFILSTLLVGSSNKIRLLPDKKALASPILCLSPAEKLPPASPTGVSSPSGKEAISSFKEAFSQASHSSCSVASGLAILKFSAIVLSNKYVLWLTMDTFPSRLSVLISSIGMPL